MTSTRVPPRRIQTQLLSPTPAKSTVSVEEWEAKAPLLDSAAKSINAIKAASESRPLPPKFLPDDVLSSRPSTPIRKLGGSSSRPGTPNLSTPTITRGNATLHALHPKQPIQTPQQFYDWFTLIDQSVARSQESHFHTHLETVTSHVEMCDSILERINLLDREVTDMLEGWRGVEEGGKSLKDACERLLVEKDRLVEMTEAIGQRLQYFQELESATRMLNHPGESLVLQVDFLYMVERVDLCIEYFKQHKNFRESDLYLLRFQQCMTRAMTLIKMYFVGSVRALTVDISRRLAEKDVSATAQDHLLYTRFMSVSSQLAPLLGELERRAQTHPDELSALLTECHTAYFTARKSLLVNRLVGEIKGLDPTRTELVELARTGCSYLKQLCIEEFELFSAFFSTGETLLYQYLENLCDYLYDDLRPRILHEPRISVLCDVCTVIQALMVLDVPNVESDEEATSDFEDDGGPVSLKKRPRGLGRLHISRLLQMVLQDAQTRLFFKAQSIIQAEIRYYVPRPDDLAYPDKLAAIRNPLSGGGIQYPEKKENVSQIFHVKSLDKQETWYPTLQKTLWVLSQLHDFVKPAIFEDIAREAINICRQSLVSAAETIKGAKTNVISQGSGTSYGTSKALDGELFLVRHLLILKEMTQNLDLVGREDASRTVDLSAVTETLASMLGRTTLLPNSLFASLGMPRGDENMGDVKNGIDQEVKKACEDVIFGCANLVCAGMRHWVDTAPANASQQTPIASMDEAFKMGCHRDLRTSVAKMRLYLEDDKTVLVLLSHVQEKIIDEYVDFKHAVGERSKGSEASLMSAQELKDFLKTICEDEVHA